ncbi:folylpolyglutamate synthase/dihydrofolate synthase family protein [Bacillus sp. NEB1478]|uniref:bifunctional folylpolyglutamate synthase/dihydrofolate synthase n=1 Tax=Bacillus sp. NEB1478 TaxID=3073816 RepID=UPI002872FAF5|nr:folylpolyglutamate synthase/dihydrofolate synthase family protein [Bacillus sp. NEB1478]WNB93261.1 folylpolyglutamate synthase/dihydrofolate synthase family protein [Bacillus sp. NEB1478]
MLKSYNEALTWIHSLLKFGIKPGLKRVEWLLERTGNPENKLKCIHVAGTNGKGSTVAYLRSMFNTAGYSAGTFTSPYLISFNERISMDGNPIEEDELLRFARLLKPLVEEVSQTSLGSPTEFEVITVISLLYFAEKKPDIVIYEVGLGGLYDSTNVITPILSLITNIGFDHMGILGDTLEEIAFQKAGIIKEEVPVISTVDQDLAVKVIKKKAKDMNAESFFAGIDFSSEHKGSLLSGEKFVFHGMRGNKLELEISMKGHHQVKNAGLALAAVEFLSQENMYHFTYDQIKDGIMKAFWAGRFEKAACSPDIILDGAHNLQGIQALRQTLQQHYTNKNIYLLFAALHDKEYKTMMKELEDIVKGAYFTSFDFPRAASAEMLLAESPFQNAQAIEPWKEALSEAKVHLKDEDVLIITGSLYFISEVRKTFSKI